MNFLHSDKNLVKAESIIGEDIKTFHLDLLIPPKILTQRKNETRQVIEGHSLSLDCNVEGSPKPEIIWKFNGKIMDPYFNSFSDDGSKSGFYFI